MHTHFSPLSRRNDLLLSTLIIVVSILTMIGITMTNNMVAFGEWAWARHHNILSWYIRPVFLIPFAFFAYKQSLTGLVLTVLGLATSMFWFPAPQGAIDPRVLEILALEREYLFGEWTIVKALFGLLVPVTFTALALAFWYRSFLWGLGVVNAMVFIKIGWTFVFTPGEGALLHLMVALVSLALTDIVLVTFVRRIRSRTTNPLNQQYQH